MRSRKMNCCDYTSTVTGLSGLEGIRPEFGGSGRIGLTTENLGAIDAPAVIAAGSTIEFIDGRYLSIHVSNVWRG